MDNSAVEEQPTVTTETSFGTAEPPATNDSDWSLLMPAEVFKSLQPGDHVVIVSEDSEM